MTDSLVISVSQLNNYVKALIETDGALRNVFVVGEISNFVNHYKSGHFYLSLKDEKAVIKAVMFKTYAQKLKFEPINGMKVICRGRVSVFDRDGVYQLYIEDMQPEGLGALKIAFDQLNEKLRNEGLFDELHKKPLPKYPNRIAVITSPTGAAVQDIMNVVERRMPLAEIIMCPVLVQGSSAAAQLKNAVDKVNELDCADVIIIGRGGGSMEDLWPFNDEALARSIYASHIPVVSAVGHETDFTICDFVSDMRAPTPSAAAELVVQSKDSLLRYLGGLSSSVNSAISYKLSVLDEQLSYISTKGVLKSPEAYIDSLSENLDKITTDYNRVYQNILNQYDNYLSLISAKLDAFSPLKTLSRGYSIVTKADKLVKSVKDINANDTLLLRLNDGVADCTVNQVVPKENL